MLIAIDTSTSWASVALFDGRQVLAELTWRSHRRSGDELFPMLERVLSLGDSSLAQVDRLAVATGPGSFTGIRVGIAAARGLARAANAEVAGVSTLDVLAFPHAPTKLRVCPLLPAGRDDWYAAFFQERHRVWARRSPFMVGPLADICRHVGTHTLFVGEFDADAEQELRDLLGPRALFPPASLRLRRAGYLAELGWTALETRRAPRIDELEPIYVKQASVGGSFEQPFAPPPDAAEALGVVRGE
ncbi:MAG: tRNA (adenosine(37)-N6)-threonylcarbamoyltransferase complex dimerization subunit type 1 TsaB [Chloroflexi bacterium 13_1_40CM_4_68_4]|nr:MAG: tRNA (adenosine(37)-N6)-threonylcarbamoyltransferase complex dimerization subunit type 1 TsaB [Chloroflexi bacterium 13_1_40CM_4_68_4]